LVVLVLIIVLRQLGLLQDRTRGRQGQTPEPIIMARILDRAPALFVARFSTHS
jgi:hypothetical protein